MTLIEAYAILRMNLRLTVFQTSDAAACLKLRHDATSQILCRLSKTKLILRLIRGRWVFREYTEQFSIPENLSAPSPSYISLQTALYHHGLISQVPEVIYAVSLSRTKVYKTILGVFSIHQVKPDFFFGYESVGKAGIKMATAEKALLDILYLSPTRSRLFTSLPEIKLSAKFSVIRARRIVNKITSHRRRTLVSNLLEKIISNVKSEHQL
ncbi:MAG: hypothetical protein HY072_05915 [Deltaproteobacteria bacterium]|nr:hypothetical protein [Deltaproteobacteria bacterium]